MTGPIIYDPTPHPVLAQLADGADAFGDVSTVVGGNFAKLNTRLRGNPSRWTLYEGNQTQSSTYTGYSDWAAMADWPAKTIKLPGRIAGAMLLVRGQAYAATAGSYPQIAFTVEPTGPGIVNAVPRWSVAVAALWGFINGARTWFFKAADLVPGQDVTLTPYVAHNDVANATISYAGWQLIVFSGDPA